MEITISDDALKYLKKNNANSVIVYTIENDTSGGCCGGMTKRYFTPEVRMGFDNQNLLAYSIYYYDGFKIFLSDKIEINKEQLIVIDIEKLLFIQKLITKGIEIKMI